MKQFLKILFILPIAFGLVILIVMWPSLLLANFSKFSTEVVTTINLIWLWIFSAYMFYQTDII